jgi:hypothetical protein
MGKTLDETAWWVLEDNGEGISRYGVVGLKDNGEGISRDAVVVARG